MHDYARKLETIDEKYVTQAEQFTGLRYVPRVQWRDTDYLKVLRRAEELQAAEKVHAEWCVLKYTNHRGTCVRSEA